MMSDASFRVVQTSRIRVPAKVQLDILILMQQPMRTQPKNVDIRRSPHTPRYRYCGTHAKIELDRMESFVLGIGASQVHFICCKFIDVRVHRLHLNITSWEGSQSGGLGRGLPPARAEVPLSPGCR